jgi:L-fuconolactonase
MVIDAHQHFWSYDPKTHQWIDDSMAVIRKDFLPSELEKVLGKNKIDGCITVQAEQTTAETVKLLEYAEIHDYIKGVVGWIDLQSNSIDDQLAKMNSYSLLKGFRHIVQGETDPHFLQREVFVNGISKLNKYGYTYDILIFPHQLDSTFEFVKCFPNQLFVIDHIAKPYIKEVRINDWAKKIKDIAQCENVYCKLSGMITEADFQNWSADQITPYMDIVINSFGIDRVMFGSDWPVCLVAGNYAQVKSLVINYLEPFSEEEKNAVMGANAIEFYSL